MKCFHLRFSYLNVGFDRRSPGRDQSEFLHVFEGDRVAGAHLNRQMDNFSYIVPKSVFSAQRINDFLLQLMALCHVVAICHRGDDRSQGVGKIAVEVANVTLKRTFGIDNAHIEDKPDIELENAAQSEQQELHFRMRMLAGADLPVLRSSADYLFRYPADLVSERAAGAGFGPLSETLPG